jgi:microcystin-dependent protein
MDFNKQNPPIGSIVAFAGSVENLVEQAGDYLVCDGRKVSKAQFPHLVPLIAGIWGDEDTNFFHLPDLRGQSLRGVDKDKVGPISPVTTETITTVTDSPTGGTESRPVNADVYWLIKYR